MSVNERSPIEKRRPATGRKKGFYERSGDLKGRKGRGVLEKKMDLPPRDLRE